MTLKFPDSHKQLDTGDGELSNGYQDPQQCLRYSAQERGVERGCKSM